MIGHVFQRMLLEVGRKEQDQSAKSYHDFKGLAREMGEMMRTQTFDNMMGPKVPHLKSGMLNLLKVVDLPPQDKAELIKMGYGELLKDPMSQARTDGAQKDRLNMQLEASDPLRASRITFNFVTFKPSAYANPAAVPKRLHF